MTLIENKFVVDEKIDDLVVELSEKMCGSIAKDVVMSGFTSYKIGGMADYFAVPKNSDDVIMVMDFCAEFDVPLIAIGRGTNLLVSDKGIAGMVMQIGDGFSDIEFLEDCRVKAGSGVMLAALSKQSAKAGLTGLEWACGIPGNVGGAVMMNAGAYEGNIGMVITKVHLVEYIETTTGKKAMARTVAGEDLCFGYRSGCITPEMVVLQIEIQLAVGDSQASLARIKDIISKRAASQPLEYPSAGSVFKNPPNSHAGFLVEQANCKGMSVGGAQVSMKHGNFIVNIGDATAADVLALIKLVQAQVLAVHGVELETEVKLIGRG